MLRSLTRAVLLAGLGFGCLVPSAPAIAQAATDLPVQHVQLSDGLDMAYRRSGHGETAIVLVHGYSLSSSQWSKVMPLFPADRFTVYAVDMRGFGNSGKPETGNDYAHLVEDLEGFLDAMHIGRAVMVGHSLAGAMVQDFLLAHPDGVSGLVISDGVSRIERPLGINDASRSMIDSFGSIEANRRVFETTIPSYFDPGNVTPEEVQAFIAVALKSSKSALKDQLTELYTIPPVPAARFKAITTPTLVIVGAHDLAWPLSQVKPLTDQFPNLYASIIIPRAGHSPMWEQPGIWAAMVREFINANIAAK